MPNGRRGMQRLTQGGLIALVPPGSELWLDGGHNPDGGRVIAGALADIEERVPRPLVLVVGMLTTKDCDRLPQQFRRAGAAGHRRADRRADECDDGRCGRRCGAGGRHPGLAPRQPRGRARRRCARSTSSRAPRIVITGSLYLAGEVLHANGTPPE